MQMRFILDPSVEDYGYMLSPEQADLVYETLPDGRVRKRATGEVFEVDTYTPGALGEREYTGGSGTVHGSPWSEGSELHDLYLAHCHNCGKDYERVGDYMAHYRGECVPKADPDRAEEAK